MLMKLLSRLTILICAKIYPSYASHQALKSRNTALCDKWIIYWIGYALFSLAESICDVLLTWIPNYYFMKVMILLFWIMLINIEERKIPLIKLFDRLYIRMDNEIEKFVGKFSIILQSVTNVRNYLSPLYDYVMSHNQDQASGQGANAAVTTKPIQPAPVAFSKDKEDSAVGSTIMKSLKSKEDATVGSVILKSFKSKEDSTVRSAIKELNKDTSADRIRPE